MPKLTTEVDQTNIAIIQTNLEYIKKDIAEIKSGIRELSGVYVTKLEIEEVKKAIIALDRSSNLWRWLSPSLSALFGSILTFLFIQYLTKLKP